MVNAAIQQTLTQIQDIQTSIKEYLQSLPNSYVRVLHGNPHCVGMVDIIAVIDGKVYFVEVKTPKGKIKTIQAMELRKAARAGAIACIVTSKEEMKKIIENPGSLLRGLTIQGR